MKGTYVANTSVQAELFGPVPRIEDSLRRVLEEAHMLGGA
jgi:hypothetical protein